MGPAKVARTVGPARTRAVFRVHRGRHVAAADDRNHLHPREPRSGERGGDAGGAARLRDDVRLAGEPLHGAGDLVLAHGDDLVDETLDVRERQVARTHRQQAVGDARGRLERDRRPGRERPGHLRGALRLDANDARCGVRGP